MLLVVCVKPYWRTDVPLHRRGQAGAGGAAAVGWGGQDLLALATAMRLRGQHPEENPRVWVVSAAGAGGERLLREALAHGADEVTRIALPGGDPAPEDQTGTAAATGAAALAVAEVIGPSNPALVLAGHRSGDTGRECFGALLAHSLGLPLAHRAAAIERHERGWRAAVKLERGYTQDVMLAGQAVVTLSGPEPDLPYPSLPSWRASLSADVPVVPITRPVPGEQAATVLRSPVPRVKRYTLPDTALDAEGRIRAMVALPDAGGGEVVGPEHGPDEQAARVAAFLRDAGYL